MKRSLLALLALFTGLLFAVGCSNDSAETEENTEDANLTVEEETDVVDEVEQSIVVTVSIDHGAEKITEKEITIEENDILMDVMKEHFEIDEEGGFINAIDGVGPEEGEEKSWMFFVNDEMAMVGAAEYELSVGDHVVFDLQPWE